MINKKSTKSKYLKPNKSDKRILKTFILGDKYHETTFYVVKTEDAWDLVKNSNGKLKYVSKDVDWRFYYQLGINEITHTILVDETKD